jgi:predicted dehydrogenase
VSTEIAFVGGGGIAGVHLDNIEGRSDVTVTGVCDVDPETAREAAAPFDAATVTDHERLFEEADFDALFVCVPPFAHGDPELLAAEHGVDLFVEKPLALDRDTAREIRDAAGDAGIVTQVGYMNRYAGITDWARRIVDDRTRSVLEGRWLGGVPGAPWWRERSMSGGQVVEQSTHVFDLVRYLAGEVVEVTAYGGQRINETAIDFEDSVTASMRHADGTVSHVTTTSTATEDHRVELDVVGDGVQVELDYDADEFQGRVDGETVAVTTDDDPYATELDAFLDAVEAGDPDRPRSPYADAYRTLDLTLAVNESLDGGEPVATEVAG